MKNFFLIIIILNGALSKGQCEKQVTKLSGTQLVNGIEVTVSTYGFTGYNGGYCPSIKPYWIGSLTDTLGTPTGEQGSGSYTFAFSPPVRGLTLDFTAINNNSTGREEIILFVNGSHYKIPKQGVLVNGICSNRLAILTAEGNIAGDRNYPEGNYGWYGTTIFQDIETLTVMDTVISGKPNGSIFSLRICDAVLSTSDKNSNLLVKIVPNPFSNQTIIKTEIILKDAIFTLYNLYGEKVLELNNISSDSITLNRGNLPSGVYFIRIVENNTTYIFEKLIIQ